MTLSEIKQNALERHIPIIMDDTLDVISKILSEQNPDNLLEIGSAIGYSAICFSKYVKHIDTIENDTERAKEAIFNINNLSVQNKINLIVGNALDILPTINSLYDIIFIDAAKSKYPQFLDLSLPLLKSNGIILADNVLFKGYVLSDYNKHKQRTSVRHLREFINTCKENPNLSIELLEVGDGLAIIKKCKNNA